MKHIPLLLVALLLVIVSIPIVISCRSKVEAPSISSSGGESPVHGGILRMVTATGPRMLGYPPMMDPNALIAVLPGAEKLLDIAEDRYEGRGLEPVLAESYEDDIADKKLVFHLRPDVRFHDGSPLDADTVIWNFDQLIEAGRLQYKDHWNGIKKIDDLTFEIYYTEYNNQLLQAWVLFPIFSRAAWNTASGGDIQKGIAWARNHCVGTGPFMLKEYVTDSQITWVKNPDYWQIGKPYLDGIEVRIIPNSQTAEFMLEAGETDFWQWGYKEEMEEKGFKLLRGWTGVLYAVWPNTADPDSKWNDIRLREAVEYAIDKQAIVNTFNPELFTALAMPVPPGEWGYDPDYPARGYEPEKAKQLLKEAGYPDGLDVEMVVDTSYESKNLATAIKMYLEAVGIRTELDVAAPGRYYATIYGHAPGPDLSLAIISNNANYLRTYMDWLSTYSIAPMAYLGHTEEQRRLDDEAVLPADPASQEAATDKAIRYVTDNAMIIPVLWMPLLTLTTPYVHIDWLARGSLCWHTEETWIETH